MCIGEGAGVVILEELEHAKKRGAKIYGEVSGYGATGDAYHITSPAEDGSGRRKGYGTCHEGGGSIFPGDVDYINAHGTSTHHNDLFETRAIRIGAWRSGGKAVDKFYKIYDRASTGGCRRGRD